MKSNWSDTLEAATATTLKVPVRCCFSGDANMADPKQDMLFPSYPYRGDAQPKNIVFNSNLQEFAQRVAIICALESNGKIETIQAYEQIKQLWKALKSSKKEIYNNSAWDDIPALDEE
ncbi:MAG: hypothetical protein AAFY15_02665 [Cyanobacteria bacterium J06648_11]